MMDAIRLGVSSNSSIQSKRVVCLFVLRKIHYNKKWIVLNVVMECSMMIIIIDVGNVLSRYRFRGLSRTLGPISLKLRVIGVISVEGGSDSIILTGLLIVLGLVGLNIR
jgi:hypothetical protein